VHGASCLISSLEHMKALMPVLVSLVVALGLTEREASAPYFGEQAQASLKQMGAGPQLLVTNYYSAMLAFAGEPSLEQLPSGARAVFRLAAMGTSVNPDCWIARFEFGEKGVRAALCSFSVTLGQPGYGRLTRREHALTPEEATMLREALLGWNRAPVPCYPAFQWIDAWPMLFEYRDVTNHALSLHDHGDERGGVFEELSLFSLRVLRTTLLQPGGAANQSQPVGPATSQTSPAAGSGG
jgi:hypothetical protein